MADVNLAVQSQWLVKWKNINNTIPWSYTNADFKKKKNWKSVGSHPDLDPVVKFTSGSKRGSAPYFFPTFFAWAVVFWYNEQHIKNLEGCFALNLRKFSFRGFDTKLLQIYAVDCGHNHEKWIYSGLRQNTPLDFWYVVHYAKIQLSMQKKLKKSRGPTPFWTPM